MGEVNVSVYGAEVKCASCVNAPGSKETFEWIQAAVARKYGTEGISYTYYDIHTENQPGADEEILSQLFDEELFYPLVLVNGEIVGEGNPRLKDIYKALESHGIQAVTNS
ncbi:YuzD family protein [Halobacillus yeomjeoni]|uniref:YuzD family protein n=1 Tax=Halobacillus yeomjeoni TaxID=311194 RepID=A0A931MVV5_9BACI|nr:YuzD family protein [Halobacillus yeomjeoni]MBH0231042.1 YuzD family protein [Halobacillus yeomjeoni]MCA0984514.1 YuzD family protein [Halobacillus yeomjeoni]